MTFKGQRRRIFAPGCPAALWPACAVTAGAPRASRENGMTTFGGIRRRSSSLAQTVGAQSERSCEQCSTLTGCVKLLCAGASGGGSDGRARRAPAFWAAREKMTPTGSLPSTALADSMLAASGTVHSQNTEEPVEACNHGCEMDASGGRFPPLEDLRIDTTIPATRT